MKNRKILITGGAGFIGSHLADFLIKKGFFVTVVDNLYLGKIENIFHLQKNSNFKFIKLDLLDKAKTNKLFVDNNFDMVYHLAANSDISLGTKDRSVDLNLNLMTTINVLEAMIKSKTRKITFASTSAVYGDFKKNISENSGPLFPVSFYGASKLSAEGYISSYSNIFDIQVWICRFPNVVGERSTHGIIFDFIKKIKNNSNELEVLGDGSQYKPYVYVKELVKNIYNFNRKTNNKLNAINLGSIDGVYVRDIAKILIKKLKLKTKIIYTGSNIGWKGDVTKYSYDLSKMKALGLTISSSKTAITKAIEKTLEQQDF